MSDDKTLMPNDIETVRREEEKAPTCRKAQIMCRTAQPDRGDTRVRERGVRRNEGANWLIFFNTLRIIFLKYTFKFFLLDRFFSFLKI